MLEESFESKIKKITSGANHTPDNYVWNNIALALHPKKKRYPFLWWLISFFLFTISISVFFYMNPAGKSNVTAFNNPKSIVPRQVQKINSKPTASNIKNTFKRIALTEINRTEITHKVLEIEKNISKNSEKIITTLYTKPFATKKLTDEIDKKEPIVNLIKAEVKTVSYNNDTTIRDSKITNEIIEPSKPDLLNDSSVNKNDNTPLKESTLNKKWKHNIQLGYMYSTILNSNGFGNYIQDNQPLTLASPTLSATNNTVKVELLLHLKGMFALDYLISSTISKKINFTTGLGYRNLRFLINESRYIDSFTASGQLINTLPISKNNTRYKINYLNVPTLISGIIISKNKQLFGWQTGVQHLILLSQQQQQEQVFTTNFSNQVAQNDGITSKYLPLFSGSIYYQLQLKKNKTITFKYEINGSLNTFLKNQPKQNNIINTGLFIGYSF